MLRKKREESFVSVCLLRTFANSIEARASERFSTDAKPTSNETSSVCKLTPIGLFFVSLITMRMKKRCEGLLDTQRQQQTALKIFLVNETGKSLRTHTADWCVTGMGYRFSFVFCYY